MTEWRKKQTVNKYRFCVSVIGYINMQIIDIGYKKSLSVDHCIGLLFVCRLNSGPVRGFSADVGNRTSIRMSYPEGSPKVWEDMDSDLRFVAVIYKSVDFHWLRAMITKTSVVSAC